MSAGRARRETERSVLNRASLLTYRQQGSVIVTKEWKNMGATGEQSCDILFSGLIMVIGVMNALKLGFREPDLHMISAAKILDR